MIDAAADRRSRTSAGIRLYLQPVQDLTVDDRVSRTQYQYTPGGPRRGRARAHWRRSVVEALRARPELRDASSDQQNDGLAGDAARSTARRRRGSGSRRETIDDTLYDAFGQRQISTIFTQLNQYRVDARGRARLPAGSERRSTRSGSRARAAARCRSARSRGAARRRRRWSIDAPGAVPGGDAVVQPRAGRRRSAAAVDAVEARRAKLGLPASIRGSFQGTAQAFQASLANEPLLILAALVTVYIVLGVLYESYIHPITILSTLPSAGVGAILALILAGTELGVIALIGIMLLIGIVKKNAIMMIDFALEAEREQRQVGARRRSTRRACSASGRS